MENWKPIHEGGLPDGYEISDSGRLKNPKGRVLKVWLTNSGYYMVNLTSRHKHFYLHRLVVKYFLGGFSKEKTEVNHVDGNKKNNVVSNLEAVSKSDNLKHGYHVLGHRRHNQKLEKVQAEEIILLFSHGMSQRKLAKMYDVSLMVVNRIINKKQYAYK